MKRLRPRPPQPLVFQPAVPVQISDYQSLTVAARMKYQQPVFRKPFGWPGSGLLIGTAVGRCQDGPIDELCGAVIPEPILSRLVALDQCMPRLLGMCCRMHVERIVAASDVATGCTPAKMQPPGASFVAFDTT